MKRLIIAVILILAATAVFATVRQDTKPAAAMMGNALQMRSMMQNSPMNMPGVEVAVTDTPDGATVSFSTKTGDVTELRRLVRQRVEMMKNMHNEMGKQ
jgi:hypothetical protein